MLEEIGNVVEGLSYKPSCGPQCGRGRRMPALSDRTIELNDKVQQVPGLRGEQGSVREDSPINLDQKSKPESQQ